MTNGDKIRRMTNEELAYFLRYGFDEVYYGGEICNLNCNYEMNCEKCILQWLNKEVEDDDK